MALKNSSKTEKKNLSLSKKTNKKTKIKDLGVYINMLTDFGFKLIFGTDANKDLLLDFLNAVLKIKGGIKELNYVNPEKKGHIKSDRTTIFDLHCTTGKGEKIIVEVQNHSHKNFVERVIYYVSRAIQEQGKKDKNWNYELCPVYSVNIVNFRLNKTEKNADKYLSYIQFTDIETHKVFYKKLTLVYIELKRFKKKITELNTIVEKWVFLFKNLHKLKNLPNIYEQDIFMKLFEEAKIANMTPKKYNEYYHSLKKLRNMNFIINEYREKLAAKDRIIAEKEYAFQQAITEKEYAEYAFQKAITEKEYAEYEFQKAITEKEYALKRIAELEKLLGKQNNN